MAKQVSKEEAQAMGMRADIVASSYVNEGGKQDLSRATAVGTKIVAFVQERPDGVWCPIREIAETIGEDFFRTIGSLSELDKMGLVVKEHVKLSDEPGAKKELCIQLTSLGRDYDVNQKPRVPHGKGGKPKVASTKNDKVAHKVDEDRMVEIVREDGHTFLAVNGKVIGTYAISGLKVFKMQVEDGVELKVSKQTHEEIFETLAKQNFFGIDIPTYDPTLYQGYDIR